MEQRANIKFCVKLGKTAAESVELKRKVYGDNCLSCAQIFRWHARFKSGVDTIEDEARPGRPFSVRNEGLIVKVRKRIQEERCETVRMMADEFGVNRETIRQILVKDLGKRKVASRFAKSHRVIVQKVILILIATITSNDTCGLRKGKLKANWK
jgi:hypothetical protein